jgi:hypothetical protein
MRVGVITHWWTMRNYGQVLQCYALQTFLENQGCDPFLIKYHALLDIKPDASGLLGSVRNVRHKVRRYRKAAFEMLGERLNNRGFAGFKKQHFKFSQSYFSFEALHDKPPEADSYIVGSDQVWGPWTRLEPYLLDFGNEQVIRLAYAASFGRETLQDSEYRLFGRLLQRFDRVGVREKSGIDICTSLGLAEVAWVPDPTILIKARAWDTLRASLPRSQSNRSASAAFCYIVGLDNPALFEAIGEHLKNEHGLNFNCTSDSEQFLENCRPTIGEWLDHIACARIVVTNSFHGVLFCLIYNTDFLVVGRTGEKSSRMNTRFTSLLGRLGCEDRLLTRYEPEVVDELFHRPMEWNRINGEIDDWRSVGRGFLLEALSG